MDMLQVNKVLKACWGTGRSCYVDSHGVKACWVQWEWIVGPGGALE